MARFWIICAALLGAAAVSLGAYHAHGLERQLAESGLEAGQLQERMTDCEIAVRYQMYHVLALLAVGLLSARHAHALLTAAGVLFLLGMIAFSGGLYVIALTGVILHWAIIPAGGTMLIAAWLVLAISGFRLTTD